MNFYTLISNHIGNNYVFNLKGDFEERRAINQFLKSLAFSETFEANITYFVSDDITETDLKDSFGAPGDSGTVIIAPSVKNAIEERVQGSFEFIPVTVETKTQSLQLEFFAMKFVHFGDVYNKTATQENRDLHKDYSVTLNEAALQFEYGIRDSNRSFVYLFNDDFKALTKSKGLKLSKYVYHLTS